MSRVNAKLISVCHSLFTLLLLMMTTTTMMIISITLIPLDPSFHEGKVLVLQSPPSANSQVVRGPGDMANKFDL